MFDKETTRLMVLQIAAIASLFGMASARIRGAVKFVQAMCGPDVWDGVWQAVTGEGTANPRRMATAPAAEDPADPFAFVGK